MTKKQGGLFTVLLIFCFFTFLIYALYFNGIGTNAGPTMAYFGFQDEARYGLIMSVASIGSIVMTILLGLFGERINKIHGIGFGLALMGVAAILIGAMPLYIESGAGYTLMLLYSLLAGIGYITIDLLMNGVVADVYPEKKDTYLPYVHAFYGVGAMLAPLLVTSLTSVEAPQTFARPYLLLGVAAVFACVCILWVGKKISSETPYANMEKMRQRAMENPAEIFRDSRAWLYLLACFLYLCFQTGLSAWLPSYGAERFGVGASEAGSILTLYFLGALAMRFLSPLFYKRMKVSTFYMLTIAVAAVLFLIFLLMDPSFGVARIILMCIGFLQGAAIPSLVILCCDAFPERTASASSVIVLGVSLAALVAPVAMGALIEQSGYMLPMLVITACLPVSVAVTAFAVRK